MTAARRRSRPRPLKAVFFDFDGVVLESAGIKTWAFGRLFDGFPRQRKEIVEYHVQNAGVSRYRKFDHIYRNILGLPLAPRDKDRLGREFSRLVLEKVMRCPMVPGARSFLERFCGTLRLFVLSGTPQRELRSIVKGRGLDGFFHGVYGSPRTKRELAARILKNNGWSAAEALFVGDAAEDYRAAKSLGVPFVARLARDGRRIFPEAVPKIRDLRPLAAHCLRRMNHASAAGKPDSLDHGR